MAALTHFSKLDTTERTASTGATELTDYTISWSDLTTAGFAAGDNVIILVGVNPSHSTSQNANIEFRVGFGTSYAGRADDATASYLSQPPTTGGKGEHYLWCRKRTLVTNENVYFTGLTASGTSRYITFRCLILNYDDLDAGDKLYAEASHGGTAPTTYDTNGAGAATPSAGDWLIVAAARYAAADTTSDLFVAINDGTSDVAEIKTELEISAGFRPIGTFAYKAGLGSGVTVRTRFKCVVGTVAPLIVTTTIFGIRLNAFADHWGAHTANTVTHTVLDTFTTIASNSSFTLSATGPLCILGWPIHATSTSTNHPMGLISVDGGANEWPATVTRRSIGDNGAAQRIAPLLYGYAASQAAGILNVAVQAADDDSVTGSNCVEQVAVAFSLELAGAPPPPAGMVHPPAGRRFQHMIVR